MVAGGELVGRLGALHRGRQVIDLAASPVVPETKRTFMDTTHRIRHGTPNTPRRKAALIAFIVSPLAILVLLIVAIGYSMRHGPAMRATPVGAGAGKTGMSNEYGGIGRDGKPPAATPQPVSQPTSPSTQPK